MNMLRYSYNNFIISMTNTGYIKNFVSSICTSKPSATNHSFQHELEDIITKANKLLNLVFLNENFLLKNCSWYSINKN